MRLLMSFDTEDFTDPLSNDVLLQIARMLTERGVRATFGLVGEKARYIRDQGRMDIVDALQHHEVAYHSDNHFLFPEPLFDPPFTSEYVEARTWDESVNRLLAVEAGGLRDIEELFGARPTTMLRTSGDSAAPLLFTYHMLGLRTYAYGLTSRRQLAPVCWFANMVCPDFPLMGEQEIYRGHAPAKLDQFVAQGVDAINVRFHPCMFIASKWWDLVNFEGTRDVNRFGPFKHAPRLASEETQSRLTRLSEFVDYARQAHDCEFITYGEHAAALPQPPRWLDRATVSGLAQAVQQRLSWVEIGGHRYTTAEVFGAVIWALLHPQSPRVPLRRIVGPVTAPTHQPAIEPFGVGRADLLDACQEAEHEVAAMRRVPAQAQVASRTVTPAALLRAAAECLLGAEQVTVTPAGLYPEGLEQGLAHWDQVRGALITLHPEKRSYTTPRMVEVVKLQHWSYKPA